MTEAGQHLEKSTSETEFAELWQRMTHNQRRFAVAMLDATTKKEAALAIGLEPNTVYGWNGEVDQAVAYMQTQTRDAVLGIIEANAVKAVMVKAAGLDSQDEIRRQDAASELLDRYLGRPSQRTEVTGAGGGPIEQKHSGQVGVTVYIPDNERGDRDSTTAGATGEVPSDAG